MRVNLSKCPVPDIHLNDIQEGDSWTCSCNKHWFCRERLFSWFFSSRLNKLYWHCREDEDDD